MLEDWSQEPEPAKKISTANPIIGIAISVCIWVVSIMVGFVTACGPGGHPTPFFPVAVFFFFAAIVGFIASVIWLIVALILNSNRE